MKTVYYILAILFSFLTVVSGSCMFFHNAESSEEIQNVVVFSWGDGKYGKAFYGAHVFLEPDENEEGYTVYARVYIGRNHDYYHDCGALGHVKTDAEAVVKWGTIEWKEDGLYIGKGKDRYYLARSKIESHR